MAEAGYLPAALSCFRKAAAADAEHATAAHLALALLCDQLLQVCVRIVVHGLPVAIMQRLGFDNPAVWLQMQLNCF